MEHYKVSSKTTTRTITTTAATTATTRFQRKDKMVTLDEEEREILRKLGESSRHQSVKPRMSTMNMKKPNNNQVIHEEKVFQVPNKNKLESKKSEDVDESAEKFIQKFKQQLVLQRLESIEKFDKMLARGL